MGHRRALLAHRARFLQRGHLERGLAQDDELREALGVHYWDWLLANAARQGRYGRMRRALIRAEQRYAARRPARIRARALHQAYARRTR
jgi:hypothetical protein